MLNGSRLQKGMNVKKLKKYCFVLLLMLFTSMQLSTLSVLCQMKEGFYNFNQYYVDELDFQTHSERYVNPNVSYIIWHKSDSLVPICYTFRNISVQDNDINISQWNVSASVFGVSWHNFFNGYMWIWYKYTIQGPKGLNDCYSGSIDIYRPVKFTIHSNKGGWIVSKIENDY